MKFKAFQSEFNSNLESEINFWINQKQNEGKMINILKMSYSTFVNSKQKNCFSALICYSEK